MQMSSTQALTAAVTSEPGQTISVSQNTKEEHNQDVLNDGQLIS